MVKIIVTSLPDAAHPLLAGAALWGEGTEAEYQILSVTL